MCFYIAYTDFIFGDRKKKSKDDNKVQLKNTQVKP